jgi:hypothetical protein
MKRSEASVVGKLLNSAGKLQLQVSGSNDLLQLFSAAQGGADPASLADKTVRVSGEIPETAKGKPPDTLRYKSMEELK